VELKGVAQQKCLAHLIRNAADVAQQKTGRARHFGRQLADTLRRALSLAGGEKTMRPADYWKRAVTLNNELTVLLRDRTLRDADNQRLLNGAKVSELAVLRGLRR
jgi:transposase